MPLRLDFISQTKCQTLGVVVGMEKEGQGTINTEGEHGDGNQKLKVDPHKRTTLNLNPYPLVQSYSGSGRILRYHITIPPHFLDHLKEPCLPIFGGLNPILSLTQIPHETLICGKWCAIVFLGVAVWSRCPPLPRLHPSLMRSGEGRSTTSGRQSCGNSSGVPSAPPPPSHSWCNISHDPPPGVDSSSGMPSSTN